MKRALFLLSAILFLAGCTKTNEFDPKPNYGSEEANPLTSIYAGFADEDSRTYVENDTDILWQNGDALSLFYANYSNVKFVYNGESGARMAKFDIVNNSGSTNDLNNFKTHALYPYNANATTKYDEATKSFNISTVFPTTQSYAPNSFGSGANVMVAASDDNVSENEMLHFRNACGFFTVKLYGEDVKVRTIKLTARNSERIAGAATIKTHAENAPEVTVSLDGSSHVVLDCGEEGVALGADKENATEFWFALPPVALNNGVHIEVTATDGTVFKKETTKKIVIERNKIQPMAALKFVQSVPNDNMLWYTRKENPTTPFEWGTGEKCFDAKITKHYYDSTNKRIVIEFATPLTTIKNEAFCGNALNELCRDMNSITLPNSLTTIGDYAFFYTGLVEFVIPGSVTYLGEKNFGSCNALESITFEPSPTNTPLKCQIRQDVATTRLIYLNINRAFRFFYGEEEVVPSNTTGGLFQTAGKVRYPDEPLTVIFGEQMPEIYNYMFRETNVANIEIPKHMTRIGDNAFKKCPYLTGIKIHNTIESVGIDAFGGCTSMTSLYIEDSATPLPIGCSLSTYEFQQGPFYDSPLQDIYMGRDLHLLDEDGNPMEPNNYYTGLLVTKYYDDETVIPNVTLSSNVTKISNHMFNYMPLNSITIPNSVTTIGDYAFRGCPNLTSITIPASVKSIGAHAFRGCSKLADVSIPTSVKTIGEQAFRSCTALVSISIPGSVETIGDDAFYDCSGLKTLRIEDSDKPLTIGYSFEGTDEYGPFYDSPLTYIYCGRDIVQVDSKGNASVADSWEEGVFTNCGYKDAGIIVSLNIGEKVTTILDYMFSQLRVKSVWFYPTVTSIGYRAFYECKVFQGLSCGHETPPTLGAGAFSGCDAMWYIRVPESSIPKFKSADGWKEFDRNNNSGNNFYYSL